MEEKRTKLQKTILLVLTGMFLVFLGLLLWLNTTRRGILVEDKLFTRSMEGDDAVYRGTLDMEEGEIRVSPGEEKNYWDITVRFGEVCRKAYEVGLMPAAPGMDRRLTIRENGTQLFHGAYSPKDDILWDESGAPYLSMEVEAVIAGEAPDWSQFRLTGLQLAHLAAGETSRQGSWLAFFFISLATVIVMLNVAFPGLFFYLHYMLFVNEAEPSDFYLACQKAFWYAMPVLLLIGYIASLVIVV